MKTNAGILGCWNSGMSEIAISGGLENIREQGSEAGSLMPEIRGQGSAVGSQRTDVGARVWVMGERINSGKDLKIYQKAYALALEIFRIRKLWPPEEKFSLMDQIRRSSRSVCANLREAGAKRKYPAHFVSKLTDADGENAGTDTRLDFAKDCGYISLEEHIRLTSDCKEIGAMLGTMLAKPGVFLLKGRDRGWKAESRGQKMSEL
ncbi:S23 ribosomal protein [delta proteobacterium NaphS2]|nr:S23 ribosomal protein [delta proteobacterium NaphS2]